jgi:hypothetical protein
MNAGRGYGEAGSRTRKDFPNQLCAPINQSFENIPNGFQSILRAGQMQEE